MTFEELGFGAAFRFVGSTMQDAEGVWVKVGIQEAVFATNKPNLLRRIKGKYINHQTVFVVWSIPEGFQ